MQEQAPSAEAERSALAECQMREGRGVEEEWEAEADGARSVGVWEAATA